MRGHARLLKFVLRITDWALVFLAGVAAYYFSNAHDFYLVKGQTDLPLAYAQVIILTVILVAAIFPAFSIYRVWRDTSIFTEIRQLTIAWCLVALLLSVVAFMTKTGEEFSRSWMLTWFVGAWSLLIGFRLILRLSLRWLRASGFNRRHAVIVGTGNHAIEVANRLNRTTWFGLDIAAIFGAATEGISFADELNVGTRISDIGLLRDFVETKKIDQVWIVLPHNEEDAIKKVIESLTGLNVEIRYVPDIFEYQLLNHSLTEVAGLPVVNISYTAIDGTNRTLKSVEDYVLASVFLVLAGPLMLLIAIGVKLSSPGPVFYRQRRVGWNSVEFTMYKFRSMPVAAEDESGPVWASKIDNRATRFGTFLRRTSLDELPQLFNVIQGKMSLIGPRPERPHFVEKYKDEIPRYMKKHLVKAGLTGWAQVHGWRGDTCLHTRIEYDLYYIENWSIWLDIKIIIMTVFRGLVHKNAY